MLAFCWLSTRRPPPEYDLARSGWSLLDAPAATAAEAPPEGCAILVDQRWIGAVQRVMIDAAGPSARARVLVLGAESGGERARLLAAGYGDALPPGSELVEVEQRALRLVAPRSAGALLRRAGPVLLDLALRDGWVAGRRLALHPMEFALAWRLAESPGVTVSRGELLRDVWRIAFDPGTNRVEVHVSRLRGKLAAAGIRGLVETGAQGGYRLPAASVRRFDQSSGPEASIGRSRAAERGSMAP